MCVLGGIRCLGSCHLRASRGKLIFYFLSPRGHVPCQSCMSVNERASREALALSPSPSLARV
jgi:hypothetical protein